MRSHKIFNWIVVVYILGIILLSLAGRISFGHGIGDLYYVLTSVCILVLHLTLTGVLYSRQHQVGWENSFLICGTAFLLIALYLSYAFTVGRGPALSWDGNIFL